MKLDAICYPSAGGDPEEVSCRFHNSIETGGDLAQSGLDFSESTEIVPRLIFLYEQHVPERGNIYSFGEGNGVYQCTLVTEREGITIAAECILIPDSNLVQYPGPN